MELLNECFVFRVQLVEKVFNFFKAVAFFGKQSKVCRYFRVGKLFIQAFVFFFECGNFFLYLLYTRAAFCIGGAFFFTAVISIFLFGFC
jgi:hypothetical protein